MEKTASIVAKSLPFLLAVALSLICVDVSQRIVLRAAELSALHDLRDSLDRLEAGDHPQ